MMATVTVRPPQQSVLLRARGAGQGCEQRARCRGGAETPSGGFRSDTPRRQTVQAEERPEGAFRTPTRV